MHQSILSTQLSPSISQHSLDERRGSIKGLTQTNRKTHSHLLAMQRVSLWTVGGSWSTRETPTQCQRTCTLHTKRPRPDSKPGSFLFNPLSEKPSILLVYTPCITYISSVTKEAMSFLFFLSFWQEQQRFVFGWAVFIPPRVAGSVWGSGGEGSVPSSFGKWEAITSAASCQGIAEALLV